MKLYIIRHGQTEWNVEGRLQGWNNSNLTEEGRLNAEKLADRLEDIDFDFIYSSTQQRAIDTANIIKGNRNKDIIKLDELKEIGFGTWEGMAINMINEKHGESFDTYLNRPHLYQPMDGESFQDIFKRAEKALKKIIKQGGENILIVSHGVTIKVLTAIIKGIPLEELYKLPVHLGTALNICQVNDSEMKFIVEGDTSHID